MDNELFSMQADICKAIAHPTRIHILQLLRDGERCVCEIFPAMKMEQPNVSRHLALLKKAGIISSRKEGLKVIYRVNDRQVFELLDLIIAMLKNQIETRNKILTLN